MEKNIKYIFLPSTNSFCKYNMNLKLHSLLGLLWQRLIHYQLHLQIYIIYLYTAYSETNDLSRNKCLAENTNSIEHFHRK